MNLPVPDFAGHYYWPSHALAMSLMIDSPLPSAVVYLILRMVPSMAYLDAYCTPDPPLYDCERCFDACSFSDLHAPRPYGYF